MSRLFDYVIESMNEPKEVDMIYEENQLVMVTAQDLVTVTEATYDYLLAEKEYYYGEITMEGLGESIGNAVGAAINGLKGLWAKIKKFFANIRDIILGKKKDKSESSNSSSNSSSSSSSSSSQSSSSSSSSSSSPKTSTGEVSKPVSPEAKEEIKKDQKVQEIKKEQEQIDQKVQQVNASSKSEEEKKEEKEKLFEEKRKLQEEKEKREKEIEAKFSSGKENGRFMVTKPELATSSILPNITSNAKSLQVRLSVYDKKDPEGTNIKKIQEDWTNDKIVKHLFGSVFGENITHDNFREQVDDKFKGTKKNVDISIKDIDKELNNTVKDALAALSKAEKDIDEIFQQMIREYDMAKSAIDKKNNVHSGHYNPNLERDHEVKTNNLSYLNAKRAIVTKASSYTVTFINIWKKSIVSYKTELEKAGLSLQFK